MSRPGIEDKVGAGAVQEETSGLDYKKVQVSIARRKAEMYKDLVSQENNKSDEPPKKTGKYSGRKLRENLSPETISNLYSLQKKLKWIRGYAIK